jgi:nucleoside-diphosphate-sugar epimerase
VQRAPHLLRKKDVKLMRRTALVTGACGFVGSHLVDQLLEDGWEVRATDLPGADRSWLPAGVPWVPADVTRRDQMGPAVQGVDVVFHAAGVSDLAAQWDPLYRVNTLGTENLLETALREKVQRVVSCSSYGVYGKFDRGRIPIDETHPVRPKDAHGRSRAMQDAVVWRYHEAGLPATVLRPSIVYGPRGRGGLAEVFRRLDRLPVVPVPLNHTQHVVSVHVKDVARAASFVAQREETIGQEYNITDDGRYTTRDFVALIAQALGKKTLPVLAPRILVKTGAWLTAWGCAGWARVRNNRPWLGRDMVYYLTFDFVASNSKIKSLGFRFACPDPASGIPETIEQMRREGTLK